MRQSKACQRSHLLTLFVRGFESRPSHGVLSSHIAWRHPVPIVELERDAPSRALALASVQVPGQHCCSEQRIRAFTHWGAHRKLTRDEIPQGIARMRAHAVRTIEIANRVPIGIVFPRDLL